MKINFLTFVFTVIIFTCEASKIPKNWNGRIPVDTITKDKFMVIKIDTINKFYVIYAKKNYLTYKIISVMDTSIINGTPIKVGGIYNLKINSVFPNNYYQKRHISIIRYGGASISLGGYGAIWDLFVTEDLKGLYFAPTCKVLK